MSMDRDGFKVNRNLRKYGIGYDMQGLLFFKLRHYSKEDKAFRGAVEDVCKKIAGTEWYPLLRFLTDHNINHTYLEIEYFIPPKRLFKWKRMAYVELAKRVESLSNDR
jgi:hypothetical protein